MESSTPVQQQPPPLVQTKLVDVPVNDQNDALQLMVRFLAIAQKRGVFSFDESAKIYECIKCFEP